MGAAVVSVAFSTVDAARITGASPRQIDYWDRTGILDPSVASAHGSGSGRRYSIIDLVAMAVMVKLCHAGFNGRSGGRPGPERLNILAEVPDAVRSAELESETCLLVHEGRVSVTSIDAARAALQAGSGLVLVLALDPVIDRMSAMSIAARTELGRLGLGRRDG